MIKTLMLAILLFTAGATFAQTTPVTADTTDVNSVDGIINALYDVISGSAGQKRNWNRMRSLFLPSGRLIATGEKSTGEIVHMEMTVEDYITTSGAHLEAKGFFERETARTQEKFGNIVHLFSTYEARRALTEEKPFMRGINSIQLLFDGKRWWIVSIMWQGESEKYPIPGKYLKSR